MNRRMRVHYLNRPQAYHHSLSHLYQPHTPLGTALRRPVRLSDSDLRLHYPAVATHQQTVDEQMLLLRQDY